MTRRPLIGVTTSEVRRPETVQPTAEGEPPQPEMTLGMRYVEAVQRAGGIPVVLPPLAAEALDDLLDRLCGICLSGGPDLHPSAYGAPAHAELGPTEPGVDVFEVELAVRADRRGLPVFGICRGAQALNVARGGTLIQHLPDVTDHSIEHRQTVPGTVATHGVDLVARTRLARLAGQRRLEVNSFHHQAVDALGERLRVSACAPDGVVEAIEATDRPHVRGVQWHAESLVDRREHLALFEELVDAARGYRMPARRAA